MLRQSVAVLVEAVRGLGTYVVETHDVRSVRIGCDRSEFPARLGDVHDALQALDADAGASMVTEDAEKMRAALLSVMRFASMRGIPREDLEDVVRQSVAGQQKTADSLTLKHRPFKPWKKWKPRLEVPHDRLGFLVREPARRRFRQDTETVLTAMGEAAPKISRNG